MQSSVTDPESKTVSVILSHSGGDIGTFGDIVTGLVILSQRYELGSEVGSEVRFVWARVASEGPGEVWGPEAVCEV